MGIDSDAQTGDPKDDVIVGIVSYANYTSLDDSGTGVVHIGKVLDWIQGIISRKVPPPRWQLVF